MNDLEFMQRAIFLAKKGRFTTAPNPNVGCVIVNHGKIVGEGFHQKTGDLHAEIHALKMAGNLAENSIVYLTLEPCNHFGKTPPCTNALIQANVKKVFIATKDPNPLVSGKGINALKNAGIDVEIGLCEKEAENLNLGFFKRMKTGLPLIRLKFASSLDGRIAMQSGESKWITSKEARQDVQIFRAESDAILTTSKTILIDDAKMNVRLSELPETIQQEIDFSLFSQPLRIILDRNHRLKGTESIFHQNGETWILSNEKYENQLDQLRAIFEEIGKKKINSLWIECGTHFGSLLINQNWVDQLIIYIAPKLLGQNAKPLFESEHLSFLNNAPEFVIQESKQIGNDLRLILNRKK